MMGKSWIAFGLAVVLLLLPMMPAAARQNRLAVGFGGVKQIPHMATLVAMERLRDRGYDTVPVFLPQSHLIIQAVLLKELDFGSTAPITVTTAILQGAPITIVGAYAMPGLGQWVLVAPKSIDSPKQLARKRIAVHDLTGISNMVVQFAIKKYGIAGAQVLVIPGSVVRAQALLQGEIDATSIFITDAIRLEMLAPGRFHILVDFKDMPVHDSVFAVRRDWLSTHQEETEDLLRSMVETHRRMAAGPEWAVARALQLFPDQDPAFVTASVRAFISRGIWDANAGMPDGPDTIRNMIKYFKTIEALPANASEDPRYYADLTYLDRVLAKVGRK
jgi:ABC-type nitrate/sulfonate/bicarbonate transport system substrate-binding protein